MTNKTLLIIKPDAIENKNVGQIISIIEKKFVIERISSLKLTKLQAEKLYIEHHKKDFYKELIPFMISSYIIILVLHNDNNAVSKLRDLVGHTDYREAKINTIRNKFGTSLTKNAVHASDSINAFFYEYKVIFKKEYV